MEHKDITGSDNHEPKGIESASSGEVYVADGAGSGSWEPNTLGSKYVVSAQFSDISTAGSIYAVAPFAGNITAIYVVLNGAITVANSNVTVEIAGVPVVGLAVTVAYSGSAAGSVFSDTAITSSNAVATGQAIEIITDGASSSSASAEVFIVITV